MTIFLHDNALLLTSFSGIREDCCYNNNTFWSTRLRTTLPFDLNGIDDKKHKRTFYKMTPAQSSLGDTANYGSE